VSWALSLSTVSGRLLINSVRYQLQKFAITANAGIRFALGTTQKA
jgi:hypothetical protein